MFANALLFREQCIAFVVVCGAFETVRQFTKRSNFMNSVEIPIETIASSRCFTAASISAWYIKAICFNNGRFYFKFEKNLQRIHYMVLIKIITEGENFSSSYNFMHGIKI